MKHRSFSQVQESQMTRVSRRAFLGKGGLLICAAIVAPRQFARLEAAESASEKPSLRIGLITDIHYADKPASRTRYYRESLQKVREGIEWFNREKMDFLVELGDLIDAADSADGEAVYLRTIEREYARFKGQRHYVFGNHDAWSLTKKQFLENCGGRGRKEYYSFDHGNLHFVILDACYRSDGVAYGNRNFKWTDSDIPPAQIEWLKSDLKLTNKPTIIFVHQRLDVKNNYGVKSAALVRGILEKSNKVLAVFQGHSHKNDYHEINGIHYCTLCAVIEGEGEENNAYSELSIYPNGNLQVKGFRRQQSYQLVNAT
jgi:alkaline phosphatase